MKNANSVKLSVFIKEEEDFDTIFGKIKSLAPFDLQKEKIKVTTQSATGFNERKIKIVEIILSKDRHINAVLECLNEKLGNRQKEMLLRQAETRLDVELYFFIRLDKEKMLNDEFWITDGGNCYHIKISIAAFPKTRENALETVKRIFS